jgi:hypothetical protein
LTYSREQAKSILAGTKLFDKVLEDVKAEQNKLTSAETQLARVREEAPDLADLVKDERLTLGACHTLRPAIPLRTNKHPARASPLRRSPVSDCNPRRTTSWNAARSGANPMQPTPNSLLAAGFAAALKNRSNSADPGTLAGPASVSR